MNAIYKFVLGLIGKRSGVITTLPNKKQIEFQANMLAEKFMQNGIDPNALKSPEQVKNVLANIDQANMRVIPADSTEGRGITEQFLGKKKADVMDMEGNKIPEGSKIMGGKEVPTSIDQESFLQRVNKAVQENRESDAAIKARLDADNKKGIAGIKINLVDDSIAKIKSMKPMDAMKEANLVAGKKGKYANLDDNQVKKIIDDTNDHIFERDIPDEDFATGGRVGLKGGAFLNFIKNMTMNKKSPLQFSKDYLKNVKEKTLRANETGKFMDLPLAEVGLPATTGALVNNQIRKKLKAMNEEQKEENLKNFIMKLENDEFYQKYPELKDETIANYTEKLFGEKKADGGRIGLFLGGNLGGGYSESRKDSGGKQTTVSFSGSDDGPSEPPTLKTKKTIPPILKKAINTGGDISYFKNLIELNPVGLGLNIGGKILFDKIFGDQSNLTTEEENMKMAELTEPQLDYLNSKTTQRDLKEGFLSPQQVFDKLPSYEEKTPFNPFKGDQEPATPQEFNEYLDTIDKNNFLERIKVADGGRIGLKGGMNKRTFLKLMGSVGATIGAAKSGIFSGFGKGAGKTVAKEVAQQTTSGMPPPYFFKLAEKIKNMGNDVTATTDRTISKSLKSKDGKSEYLLEQDVSTGDTIIKKINKEGDEMITDVEIMELKKGEVVIGKDGKAVKVPDEYEEVTESNARIEGDVFNDPYYSDGIEVDEIIKEVDDKVPSIKYATGGRVPYFKGGLAALKTLMNYFAKEKGTTGSKLLSDINPKKIDSGIKNLMSKEELNQLKENRTEYVKHLLNIIKSDKKFLDNNRAIVEETIAQAPIGMEDIAKEISDSIKRNAMKENRLERLSVYDKVNPDDAIMDVEMMIKNMSTGKKDKRALNATGGLAYMLGE